MFGFLELQAGNSQGMYSPFSGSQGTASVASPMSTSLSPVHGSDYKLLKNATSTYYYCNIMRYMPFRK